MFSNYNGIKLEIKNRKTTGEFPEHLDIKQLLSISWVEEVVKEFFKKYVKPNENKNSVYQNMCDAV